MPSPGTPLIEVKDIHVRFPVRSGFLRRTVAEVKAVSGVSLTVESGKTLGIVGESGCGKTTLGRTIAGLQRPDTGEIRFDGVPLTSRNLKAHRREIQMIFQDPYSSLNPRMTVRKLIQEAWKIHRDIAPNGSWDTATKELLELVGLSPDHIDRYPHQFSGGQRQRIGVARCLAAQPRVIICDEPVSALDVSIQAQIVNLLQDIQEELDLSYVFIAHDLAVVRHISDVVAVMYLGKVVELATAEAIYEEPTHPYTQALLSSVLAPDPQQATQTRRIELVGDVPSPINPPSGCRFRTRCWKAESICAEEEPALIDRALGHPSACHFADPLFTKDQTSG